MYPYAQAVNQNARKTGGFLSSSNRFGVKRQPGREEANPGPGTYESQKGKNTGGLMVTKEARFRKNKADEVPGPGAYEVSVHLLLMNYLQSCIYKMHFLAVIIVSSIHTVCVGKPMNNDLIPFWLTDISFCSESLPRLK